MPSPAACNGSESDERLCTGSDKSHAASAWERSPAITKIPLGEGRVSS